MYSQRVGHTYEGWWVARIRGRDQIVLLLVVELDVELFKN